jgi:hypothetical protein
VTIRTAIATVRLEEEDSLFSSIHTDWFDARDTAS